MYRIISLCLLLGCLVAGCEPQPERLTGDATARSPEGWRGRRYMKDGRVISEEFDTNGDGRMDRWRYFAHGLLILEEFDENGDGRINRRERHLTNGHIQVEADTNHDGRMDHWTQFNEKGVPVMYGVDRTGDGRVNEWLPMPGVSRREPDPVLDAGGWQAVEPEPFPYDDRSFEQREFRDPSPRPDPGIEDMSLPPYGEVESFGSPVEPTWDDLDPVLPDADVPVPPYEEDAPIVIPDTPSAPPAPPAPPRVEDAPPQPLPPSRYPRRHPSEGLEE